MLKSVLLVIAFLLNAVSYAQDNQGNLDSQLGRIYDLALEATTQGDIDASDFYLARYMGLTIDQDETQKSYYDLYPIFQQRQDLAPVSFISNKYTDEFIDYFKNISAMMWDKPDEAIDAPNYEFIIGAKTNSKYLVQIRAKPSLQSWLVLSEPQHAAVLALAKDATVHVGKLDASGKPDEFFEPVPLMDGLLHHLISLEFYDLDKDGNDELWVRYNKAWADGFSQELDIFKLDEHKGWVLFKNFSGQAEGIARRMDGNQVQVGTGFSDKDVGHLSFDQTRLETYAYNNGQFIKTEEKSIPHILWSEVWKEYYFGGGE